MTSDSSSFLDTATTPLGGTGPSRCTVLGALSAAGTIAVLAIFALSFSILSSPPPSLTGNTVAPYAATTPPDAATEASTEARIAPAAPATTVACPLPALTVGEIVGAAVSATAHDHGCTYAWNQTDPVAAGRLAISAYAYADDVMRALTIGERVVPYGGADAAEVLATAREISAAGNASLGRWERVVVDEATGLVSDGWSTAIVASDDHWYDVVMTRADHGGGSLPFLRDLARTLTDERTAGSPAGGAGD